MALLSGAAIPHDGIAEIAENALALSIEKAQAILRFTIAGARELGQLPRRIDIIVARIGRQRRSERPPPSRAGVGSRRSLQGRASRRGRRHRIRRRGGGPLLWRALLWRPLLWRIEHFRICRDCRRFLGFNFGDRSGFFVCCNRRRRLEGPLCDRNRRGLRGWLYLRNNRCLHRLGEGQGWRPDRQF